MANEKSATAQNLIGQLKEQLDLNQTANAIPFDPNSTNFPKRKDVPQPPYAPEGVQTAWVWGEKDMIGRLNLLTPARVKSAASSEIKTGETVPLNLPLNHPETPAFHREKFEHEIKTLAPNVAYDDLYKLNTQSGTQWDGFRHFSWRPTRTFYNNTKGSDIVGPEANDKCSIHHWSTRGIAGRGVLLDYASYCEKKGLRFNPYEADRIPYSHLEACGKEQGIDIRPQSEGGGIQIGDLLFIRSGWIKNYYNKSSEEWAAIARRPFKHGPEDGQRWGGVKQEEPMIDWLHDCYFAAVGGDAPSFEAWPTDQNYHLHEYLLALWGCPIGEMIDLERLSEVCKEKNRWTFFVTSSPANLERGVSTHVNGLAIF